MFWIQCDSKSKSFRELRWAGQEPLYLPAIRFQSIQVVPPANSFSKRCYSSSAGSKTTTWLKGWGLHIVIMESDYPSFDPSIDKIHDILLKHRFNLFNQAPVPRPILQKPLIHVKYYSLRRESSGCNSVLLDGYPFVAVARTPLVALAV